MAFATAGGGCLGGVEDLRSVAHRAFSSRWMRSGSANGEDALHPCGGVSGDGAEVAELARLLERDCELRALARLDQRRRLSADVEVVLHMADVLEHERDRSGLRDRLRRELEEELAPTDLDRRRGGARLPVSAGRGERDDRKRGDRDGSERVNRTDGQAFHLQNLLGMPGWLAER